MLVLSVSFPSHGGTSLTMHALFKEVQNQRRDGVQQKWMKMEFILKEVLDTVAQNAQLKKSAGQLMGRSVSSPLNWGTSLTMYAQFI